MQLSRARRLSSERTMRQGANLVFVAFSITSRAFEYWYHRPYEFEIHRAELPLSQGIVNASQETPFLLFLADLQPELDQHDTAVDDILLDFRAQNQEIADAPPRCKTPSRTRRRRGCTSCDRR